MSEGKENPGLRICLVGPSYPYRGGISHYNTRLAIELEKRHEVRIVNYSRLYPEFLFPGKTQLDESDTPFSFPSRRIIDSMNPFTWVRTGFHIAAMRPQAVVVQWWHPYFAPAIFKIGAILRLFCRGKIIFICHNVVPHERSIVDRLLSGTAFSIAHGFLVQSNEDRHNLLKLRRGGRVKVHPLPLFDFFAKRGLSKDEARKVVGAGGKPLILFFGYVRPYKGLRFLIEAMPLIRKRIDADLLVVGEFYEDSGPYRSLVERLGLSDYVRFVDRYVGNEEVEAFFVACDLVMLPYVSATQSGIVQIALSFDRPVIVTEVGGLPEVVASGKTGFAVPAQDSGALAEAAVRFFEEGWSELMAPFFEQERKRFSWSAVVSSVEELLEAIEGGGGGG